MGSPPCPRRPAHNAAASIARRITAVAVRLMKAGGSPTPSSPDLVPPPFRGCLPPRSSRIRQARLRDLRETCLPPHSSLDAGWPREKGGDCSTRERAAVGDDT